MNYKSFSKPHQKIFHRIKKKIKQRLPFKISNIDVNDNVFKLLKSSLSS